MKISLAHTQKLRPKIHQGLGENLNKTQKNHPPHISKILHQAAMAHGHRIPPNMTLRHLFRGGREGGRGERD